MTAIFTGPKAIEAFRLTTLASGLRMYAATGMWPNRMWTPAAMLKAASLATGCKFKRGEYLAAAIACSTKSQQLAVECAATLQVRS